MKEIKKGNIDMKSIMRKFIITLCAVSTVVTMSATAVFATDEFRPGPGADTSVTENVATSSAESNTSTTGNASEPTSVTTQATGTSSKYLSKWGGFFWFLASVGVNFLVACWVGNRFYRLARRSAQSSAEIRALRKDIEEKFASTLKDINEPITEVVNTNESYARNEEGIEMPENRPSIEINDEEREILGRWDTRRAAMNEIRAEERESSRRTYAPDRAMSGIEFEEDDATEEKGTGIRSKLNSITKAGSKAGNKAKDFLSNIFPFED